MDTVGVVRDAIAYLEDHLDQDLGWESLAVRAGLSPFHFHRAFRSLTGEPVKTYLRLRRMDKAAHQLAFTRRRILDLAFESGFQSQAAFSRAFFQAYGRSPGEFRRHPGTWQPYPRLEPRKGEAPPELAPPRFETLAFLRVAGLGGEISMDGYEGSRRAQDLWGRFLKGWGRSLPPSPVVFGLGLAPVSGAVDQAGELGYFPCAPLPEGAAVPPGLVSRLLPGGPHAVFEYTGPARLTRHAFDHIFGVWMPRTGYTLRIGAEGTMGFERYVTAAQKGTIERSMSLFVPVDQPVSLSPTAR